MITRIRRSVNIIRIYIACLLMPMSSMWGIKTLHHKLNLSLPIPFSVMVYVFLVLVILLFNQVTRGPGSSVGIVTGYRLDDPGIESRWGLDFRICSERPWGPPSLLYNGCRVFLGGRMRPGRDADPSPLLVPWSKNRVELYLYSP
jgi:hypothetical protein